MDTCKYMCIFLLSVLNVAISLKTHLEGYYWRDFEGIIPEDALPAGLDQNGKPIYLGQILHDKMLIPGKIYTNDNKIFYELGYKELTRTKNVKILCSQYPEQLEWVPTKHDEVVRLTNKLLIKGGYEPDYSTYLGRAYSAGETTVGKVICQENDCLGLLATRDGKQVAHRDAFEVLVFNPKTGITDTKDNCNLSLDIRMNNV